MITLIALIIAIIGALNWFVIGIAGFNTVAWIFGGAASLGARIVYTLVGIAGIWLIGYIIKKGSNIVAQEKRVND
jgi:uncharacterized membrane protein YuzA (DUF378 family)